MVNRYKTSAGCKAAYDTILIVGCLFLIIKWTGIGYPDLMIVNLEVHFYISKLSLSMLLYTLVGNQWLLAGKSIRTITALGIGIILGGILFEVISGIATSIDIFNIVYWLGGVLIAYVYLRITYRKGLIPL